MGGRFAPQRVAPKQIQENNESKNTQYAYTNIISYFLLNANFFHGIGNPNRTASTLGAFSWITIRVESEGLMAIRKVGKYFQVDYYDPNGKRIRKNFKKKKGL